MDPEIRYCTTSDGVSIAYWSIGDGDAVIDMGQPPPTHIQLEWRLAPIRAWYERFARHRRFVRFDTRGTGMSERETDEYSLETQVRDTEAVADTLGIDRFTLIGQINSGAAAIAYAARHPERVAQLILWCAYARGPEFFDDSGTKALRDMIDRDWNMMTETASRSRFGWTDDAHARDYAELWRAAVSPTVMTLLMDTLCDVDVTPLLSQVQARTLVLQRERRGADIARRIAAGIPDATVSIFEGASAAPYLADADAVWERIASFLGVEGNVAVPVPTSSLQTILFTDVVANTSLLQQLGDDRWRALLREHDLTMRAHLSSYDGSEIKTTGDGFMASFGSAVRAVECAIALQRTFAGEADGIRVRIGLNAGEPIAEDNDLFGTAVTTAARIQAQALGGEILVSDVVRQLVAGKGFTFADRGKFVPKGFTEPVRLYEVRWSD